MKEIWLNVALRPYRHILFWLRKEHLALWDANIGNLVTGAIMGGQVALLRMLLLHGKPIEISMSAICRCVSNGDAHMLDFLRERNLVADHFLRESLRPDNIYEIAASSNRFALLRKEYRIGYVCACVLCLLCVLRVCVECVVCVRCVCCVFVFVCVMCVVCFSHRKKRYRYTTHIKL